MKLKKCTLKIILYLKILHHIFTSKQDLIKRINLTLLNKIRSIFFIIKLQKKIMTLNFRNDNLFI